MKTFLRALDRILIHLYFLTGLYIALSLLLTEAAYDNAAFTMLKVQAQVLVEILSKLQGLTT
jgi:hypothetical protein